MKTLYGLKSTSKDDLVIFELMEAKYWHKDQKKDIDLIGLGNAIVDIIVNVEEQFLEVNNLKKGSMNLINSYESEILLENCKVIKKYPEVRLPILSYVWRN